jgi:hypothetical protein
LAFIKAPTGEFGFKVPNVVSPKYGFRKNLHWKNSKEPIDAQDIQGGGRIQADEDFETGSKPSRQAERSSEE